MLLYFSNHFICINLLPYKDEERCLLIFILQSTLLAMKLESLPADANEHWRKSTGLSMTPYIPSLPVGPARASAALYSGKGS